MARADRLFSEASRHEERINNNWHDMPFHERFVQVNLLDKTASITASFVWSR